MIIETAQDILEVKAAIFGARAAFEGHRSRQVPIQASVVLLPNGGKMLLGTDITAVLATLEALKVDVIGLNCSTGPEDMRDAVRFLGEHARVPGLLHPQRRPPAPGPGRRDGLPGGAPSRWPPRSASSSSATACRSSAAAAAPRPSTSPRSASAAAATRSAARPSPAPPARLLDDRRAAARAGSGAHDRRRARQLAGLAQGQGAAARRRLRRRSSRSPRTRSMAARTCSTSASALTERTDEAEQMRHVVKKLSLSSRRRS